MGQGNGRVGLVLSFVTFLSSLSGCTAYEVTPADRNSADLAKVHASQLMSAVESAKRPERDDPALAESLRQARANEAAVAKMLTHASLKAEEVRALAAALVAWREGLSELAKAAEQDGERYTLSADPEKAVELHCFVAQMEKCVSRIEKDLGEFQKSESGGFIRDLHASLGLVHDTLTVVDEVSNHRYELQDAAAKAFDRQLRAAVAALGDELLALDRKLERRLVLEIEQLAGDQKRVAAARRRLADVDAAILAWLEEVDGNLKAIAASGSVAPGFLGADRLTRALEAARAGEAGGARDDPLARAMAKGIGLVEELAAGATEAGVEPRVALASASEEFSKVVAKYAALHQDVARAPPAEVAEDVGRRQ